VSIGSIPSTGHGNRNVMFVKTPATQTHSEFGRASTGLPSTRYSGPPLDHKVVFEHGRTDLGMNLPYDSSLLWFVRQTPPAKFLSHAVRATLALSPLLSSYPLPSFLSLSLIIFSFCSLPSFPSSSTTPTSAQHPSLKPKTTDPTPHASLVSPNHKPQTTNHKPQTSAGSPSPRCRCHSPRDGQRRTGYS